MDIIAALLTAVLAVWGVYTTFLVMGAMFGSVIDNGSIRYFGALALALVIPIITAMGANSRKEEATGAQRLTRVGIGTTIFSMGCAVIVAIALAGKVVPTLESNPNWFLSNPDSTQGVQKLNRKYSNIIAGISCRVAHKAGTYYCPPNVGR